MIICEIGLNHMGDVKYANEYIDKIIDAKADGVLFHIRESSFYQQKKNLKFDLPENFYIKTRKKLKQNKIKFGVTIADTSRINFCERINVDFYKIFSGFITNKELISTIKKTNKKIFLSTGMSDMTEISDLVKSLKNHKKFFTLIHTQLDFDINIVNLNAIPMMRKKLRMDIAYGNHAVNTNTLYLALAYAPSDLLFYVKGSKFKKHVDDPHAVKLDDLNMVVSNLRELPKAIGKSTKIKMQSNIK